MARRHGRASRDQASVLGRAAVSPQLRRMVALEDVSVAVTAGQVTAVVGGDGAGKTSLLRCLAGVPTAGCRGGAQPRQVADRLPAGQLRHLPGPDRGREPRVPRDARTGMRGAARERGAHELTERAGLAAARDRLAGQLSGGMRQKLGVIAALLHRPELLILDEPSTGVDPVSRSGLWWLIASAAADGAAVILATTYLDDAQRAGTVLVLDAGRPLAVRHADQIVAAMPGSVRGDEPAAGWAGASAAWRRGQRPGGSGARPERDVSSTDAELAPSRTCRTR